MDVKELKDRYRVKNIWSSVMGYNELYRGTDRDPYLLAYADAELLGIGEGDWFDVSVGIAPNGLCVTQIIVFKDERGYRQYVQDGATIFDGEVV